MQEEFLDKASKAMFSLMQTWKKYLPMHVIFDLFDKMVYFFIMYLLWKRNKKTYSPMDDDEQKDKTHSSSSIGEYLF